MLKAHVCVPESVLAVLAFGAPAFGAIFADANISDSVIEDYRDRQVKLVDSQTNIMARADAEKRELSAEESKELDELAAECERLDNQIERRERALAQAAKLNQGRGRVTEPDPIQGEDPPAPAPRRPVDSQRPRVESVPSRIIGAHGTFGFRSFGDFAAAVKKANPKFGGEPDRRLIQAAAATTYGSEGVGADGGFTVPPDFRAEIMSKVFGEDSLVARTDRQRTTSNTITFPSDMTTPWQTTGGIQAFWTGEAIAKTQSKPTFENVTVKANTLAVLVPVTEELLEDAPALDGYLRRKSAEKMDFKISYALGWGTGVGMPLGWMNAACLVTVAAEGGQTTKTINATNVLKMYSRMPTSSLRTALWVIHPDAQVQLPLMTIGNQVAYIQPGGLRDNPYGTLLGRPVIPHQIAETVGDLGDIMFVDLNQYLTLTKTGAGRDADGFRSDVSIHLWFDQDLVAYRFTIRLGGQPWWSAATAQRDGTNTQSPFVTLASR